MGIKTNLGKRIEKLEKVSIHQTEIEYKPDFSDWTVPELKMLEGWMKAGEVDPLPEGLKEMTIKYVNPTNLFDFMRIKLMDLYKGE